MINETIYYTTRVDDIFTRLRQSLSRYLKGTHRVGGQLKFFERRPLNPTCVFKTQREKEEKKNGTVSFLIRQSIHASASTVLGT